MGTYEQLKQALKNVIKSNGNQEITGAILQSAVLSIVSTVGENATFAGIATPSTNPGNIDANVFYFASIDGIYTNFNGLKVSGEVAIFTNKSGSWQKLNTGFATVNALNNVHNIASSVGYVTCDTPAATASKTITVIGVTTLTTGIRLLVKMSNNNTAANATLNINSLGAKPLYYDNERVNGDNAWAAGEVVEVYYDGTNFYSSNILGGAGSSSFNEIQRTLGIDVVWSDGQLETKNGEVGAALDWQHTDYIPIYGNVSFYTELTLGNYYGICFYDKDKAYLNSYVNLTTYTNIITPPKKAVYVRFCNKKTSTPTPVLRVNNGDTKQILDRIKSLESIDAVTLPILTEYIEYIGSNMPWNYKMNSNKAIDYTNGSEQSHPDYELSDYIPVIEGIEYKFNAVFGLYYGLLFYSEAKKESYIKGSGINNTYDSDKIVAPKGAKYVRFSNKKENSNPWFLISGPFITPPEYIKPKEYMLLGASFASPANTWFEQAIEKIGGIAINKATDGSNIIGDANKLYEGTLYNDEELENTEALVIMHVHNKNVNEGSLIQANYDDYTLPFEVIRDDAHYSAAFDYVIKKYMADCYNLKDKAESQYYGTNFGKPCKIILCTHWHDARVTYNTAIREVATKFGLSLIEFDKNIGFSKDQVHSVTLQQTSILYANVEEYLGRTEVIDDVTYGWHPTRGRDAYIQQKMAKIAYNTLVE